MVLPEKGESTPNKPISMEEREQHHLLSAIGLAAKREGHLRLIYHQNKPIFTRRTTVIPSGDTVLNVKGNQD
jgi:hypothetical protein